MRPQALTWALKEVNPVGLHRQSGKPTSNLILLHISKNPSQFLFGRKMGPLTSGTLCLSTPKHNGKSGTDCYHLKYFR